MLGRHRPLWEDKPGRGAVQEAERERDQDHHDEIPRPDHRHRGHHQRVPPEKLQQGGPRNPPSVHCKQVGEVVIIQQQQQQKSIKIKITFQFIF